MARIETDPNYNSPTFSRATAATDPFKKEDVQALAAALSTHDHTNGKGLGVGRLASGVAIADQSITGAMIQDATITQYDVAYRGTGLALGGNPSSNFSTSSASFVDVPGFSVSFTLTMACDVTAIASFPARIAGATGVLTMALDGTNVANLCFVTITSDTTHTMNFTWANVGAGAHTIKVVAQCSGGTLTMGFTGCLGFLSVIATR